MPQKIEGAPVRDKLSWKLVAGYRQHREQFFPSGTRRRRLLNKLQRSLKFVATRGVLQALRETLTGISRDQYARWIAANEPDERQLLQQRELPAKFAYQPLISIVTPVYNPEPRWLEKCIESVLRQSYPKWEFCICDDGSTRAEVGEILRKYRERDERIKVVLFERNQGISLASNEALKLATGEYVALLDNDDELSPEALYQVVGLLQQRPDADMIYSDEDKLEPGGEREEPFFKPDWSPEYFRCCMYTCHLGVYRRELLNEIGGFRPGFEGSQDYDLVLRLSEKTYRIYHLPKVLYHWRMVAGSAAESVGAKPYAYLAATKALAEHLERSGLAGTVLEGKWPGHYRAKLHIDTQEKISIIIPTRDKRKMLKKCLESIAKKTSYTNYEIVIVDNDSADPATREYLRQLPHKVVQFTGPFNFSRVNNFAAEHTTGKYLVFLNNDTEVISGEWLSAMLEFAQQPEIGIVGARLLYPNNTIQHAGVVLGLGGVAGHALTGFAANAAQHFGLSGSICNWSAVTAACMMMRREVFDLVGGFDENLSVSFNDVDLCLRVREKGFRIVYTPYAELYHHESASRGYAVDPKDIEFMLVRWGDTLRNDPYYNPNLTLERPDFSLRI